MAPGGRNPANLTKNSDFMSNIQPRTGSKCLETGIQTQKWQNYLYIDMYEEKACEIDIRTLTSQQVLGQILDQIFDQVLDQGLWTRKYSVQL